MSSWEHIEVNTESEGLEEMEKEFIQTDGLAASPEQLHNEFHVNAEHLSEVEQRHKQVLVTSGMIPEEHLSCEEKRYLALSDNLKRNALKQIYICLRI